MVMAVFAFGLNGYNARSCLPIYDRASGSDVNKVGAFVLLALHAGSVAAYHVKSAQQPSSRDVAEQIFLHT